MDPSDQAAAHHRRALDFMLDALDLQDARDEAHRGARLFASAPYAQELIRAYSLLLRRVAELERALAPDEAELDALARAADKRSAQRSERGADEI